MPGNDLAIVIPVFNEAPNVMTLVADLPAWLKDIDGEAIFFLVSSPASSVGPHHRVRIISAIHNQGGLP